MSFCLCILWLCGLEGDCSKELQKLSIKFFFMLVGILLENFHTIQLLILFALCAFTTFPFAHTCSYCCTLFFFFFNFIIYYFIVFLELIKK